MRYSTLPVQKSTRQTTDVFRGYNHNLRIGDGEFYDMKNLTSDYYPILAPRPKRGVHELFEVEAMLAKDSLCFIHDGHFVMNRHGEDLGLQDFFDDAGNIIPKQMVSMGAYVIILPDKKYINTADLTDKGAIEAEWVSTSKDVTFSLCTLTGDPYADIEEGDVAPENTEKKWLDTSSTPHLLKQYASASDMWVTIPTTYIKVSAEGIGAEFREGDGVTISGIVAEGVTDLNGTMVVRKCDLDYIVVTGILDNTAVQTAEQGSITVGRYMPEMDFVIESENRLWGCRYGLNRNGNVVNEIYCSKLGDFKNWNCFMGLATDSYAVSCGTDGPFTGAITHLGHPLFFKETCLHKVYGNYPANFQVQATACRGVQKGSAKSLAIVNEILYYKSRLGVCGYDGSLPVEVSAALGETAYFNAVGGAHGNKYYISMADDSGIYHLFVYDTARGMWHKEDNTQVKGFCSCRNELYFVADGKTCTYFSNEGADNAPVEWMAQTGIIGVDSPDSKYISRLNVRMALEIGTVVSFFIEYDSTGTEEFVGTTTGTSLCSFSIPIRPRRCDHLRLKIKGQGPAKIFSITKTIEQGSDQR